MKWIKRLLYVLAGIAVIAAVVISFLPKVVPVDVATIDRVPLRLTVDEEGITRLRERYVVSTPLAGRLERIVLDVGDRVEAGKTELALLEPTAPQLLDPRDLAMTQARVKAAEGRLRRSEAELQRVRTNPNWHRRSTSGSSICISVVRPPTSLAIKRSQSSELVASSSVGPVCRRDCSI